VPSQSYSPAIALTIAGSDSGGGAGLQADLKAFAAHGVHGTSVVTAVTAQSTTEVRGVVAMDPEFVVLQIETVTDDLQPAAVKTGMLANAEIVAAVAEQAARGRLPQLVVDPVLVSSTGHPLMSQGGIDAYLDLLVPHALVLTPNLREAAVLTGRKLEDLSTVEAMTEAANELRGQGATYVVVKGGHLNLARAGALSLSDAVASEPSGDAIDVVVGPHGTTVLPGDRVATPNDHGTGCSMAAAVAAGLALGTAPVAAIENAKAFVARGLRGGATWRLGAGHGPIDHFGWSEAGPQRQSED
jgi:hydroxymethylpyrimidine kinase/phosphomethylpyrimidine kinase